MTADVFRNLKNGDRVRHVDGTLGTIRRQRGYLVMEILWDDETCLVLHVNSQADAKWAETDIEMAA